MYCSGWVKVFLLADSTHTQHTLHILRYCDILHLVYVKVRWDRYLLAIIMLTSVLYYCCSSLSVHSTRFFPIKHCVQLSFLLSLALKTRDMGLKRF